MNENRFCLKLVWLDDNSEMEGRYLDRLLQRKMSVAKKINKKDLAMTPTAITYSSDLINTEPTISLHNFSEQPFELTLYSGDTPFVGLLKNSYLNNQHDFEEAKPTFRNRDERRYFERLELKEECVKTRALVKTEVSIVRDSSLAVNELVHQFEESVEKLLVLADSGASPRRLEEKAWEITLQAGQAALGQALARISARASEAEIKKQRYSPESIYFRMDQGYHITITTTFGDITFPLFAFRVRQPNGKFVTYAPARTGLFPFHDKCHSSELCLEWESRLGSQQTFRESESSLLFFSHGAVRMADNTIAAHTVKIGSLIDRDYLYRSPAEIREILETHATRNIRTGKPIVYFSTDAHALRRFIDETWHGAWKMTNGLRIWCVDQKSGQIIHLGGEFTWGDCEVVEEIFKSLTQSGHLPADGNYGEGIRAEYVIVTDGAVWIEQRIVPIFPGSCGILDAYHALETIAKHAKDIFGAETPEAKAFYSKAAYFLLGETVRSKPEKKPRKGHKKTRKQAQQMQPIEIANITQNGSFQEQSSFAIPQQIRDFINFIQGLQIFDEKKEAGRQSLLEFLRGNAHRIDYLDYKKSGYKIGSGAMESIHRTGSQMRLKIAGARWLKETAQAIFNIRMMTIVGKWNDFWKQENITEKLVRAFNSKFEVAAI